VGVGLAPFLSFISTRQARPVQSSTHQSSSTSLKRSVALVKDDPAPARVMASIRRRLSLTGCPFLDHLSDQVAPLDGLPSKVYNHIHDGGITAMSTEKSGQEGSTRTTSVTDEESSLVATADSEVGQEANADSITGHVADTPPRMPGALKVTVNLPEDLATNLKQLAARDAKTFTQVLKEAISLKLFVDDLTRGGAKLLVEHRDKTIERIVFH
jgi:hypothetical protein